MTDAKYDTMDAHPAIIGAFVRASRHTVLVLGLVFCVQWSTTARSANAPGLPGRHQTQTGQTRPDEQDRQTEREQQAGRTGQDEPPPPQFDDEVVVVGSRAQPRSVTESTVPIDAIPSEDFAGQAGTDIGDQLRTIVPSYNVNPQPVGDAGRLIRPANLRGLAPDHTLVLVNGKRRHRGAVITWIGNGVADGAQGPDISTIPAIALRQIEVLRDGAAAQYGSDAIAGVLNFLLKDDRAGGSLELHAGGYGPGDGGTYTVAGNVGLPLGQTGFANLSVEYGNAGRTSRSVQREDAALLIAAGNDAVADPAQIWGSPRVDDNIKLWGNFGHLFSSGVQAYGYANYASRRAASGFFFRWFDSRDLYVYHADSVFDLEAVYPLGESTTLTIGSHNLFSNDPEENPIASAKGNRFSAFTPFGINGGFYYVRVNYRWNSTP